MYTFKVKHLGNIGGAHALLTRVRYPNEYQYTWDFFCGDFVASVVVHLCKAGESYAWVSVGSLRTAENGGYDRARRFSTPGSAWTYFKKYSRRVWERAKEADAEVK